MKNLIIVVSIFEFLYLAMSFVCLDLNFINWDIEMRIIYILLSVVLLICVLKINCKDKACLTFKNKKQ